MSPYYSQTISTFLWKTTSGRCHCINPFPENESVTKRWALRSVGFRLWPFSSVCISPHISCLNYYVCCCCSCLFYDSLIPNTAVRRITFNHNSNRVFAKALRLFSISFRVKSKSFDGLWGLHDLTLHPFSAVLFFLTPKYLGHQAVPPTTRACFQFRSLAFLRLECFSPRTFIPTPWPSEFGFAPSSPLQRGLPLWKTEVPSWTSPKHSPYLLSGSTFTSHPQTCQIIYLFPECCFVIASQPLPECKFIRTWEDLGSGTHPKGLKQGLTQSMCSKCSVNGVISLRHPSSSMEGSGIFTSCMVKKLWLSVLTSHWFLN